MKAPTLRVSISRSTAGWRKYDEAILFDRNIIDDVRDRGF